jgi:hypothetical protein
MNNFVIEVKLADKALDTAFGKIPTEIIIASPGVALKTAQS